MTAGLGMLALMTDAFGGRGGIAQYNRDLLTALSGVGAGAVSSVMVMPRHAPDPFELPSKVIQQAPARPDRIAYVAAVLRLALSRRIEMVFCGHLFMAPLAALIARLKGAKLIIQMHGVEAWARPSRLRRAAVEAADLVLCVSRHTRGAVLGWAAIVPERVLVLPNTVGDIFKPGDAAALRSALGIEGKRVLLTVGRMDSRERYKGHDRVIAALPELVARGHDVIYLVVGEGDDRARLEALARDKGGAERVRFLGPAPLDRLAEIYRLADLFVMPSTGEGFGIAFLEAMASGTPALGLNIAGARDALADGELGITASGADLPAALAAALAATKPDPLRLAAATQVRFGRSAFEKAAASVFERFRAA